MEIPEIKELTPEQRKEISKILSKARTNLFLISIKFGIGIFAANLVSLLIGVWLLSDIDPQNRIIFQFVCLAVNLFFMSGYLNRRMKSNSDIVVAGIKEVLKNKTE